MPRPKDTNKKSVGTSRASNRKGNASDVQKAISANTKKYNAMTSAQKKAYNVKQAKSVVKGVVTVASMVGGPGLARKAGAKAAKAVTGGVRNAQRLARIKAQGRLTTTMRTTGQLKNEGSKFEFTTKANSIRQGKTVANKYANRYASQTKDKAINVVTQQRATGPRDAKGLAKIEKALRKSVNSKNLKGKLGTTPANQPSRPLDRNIARGYVLRKKFPDKFRP